MVNNCYLSDGSKAEALREDGTGLVYRGSLIYRKAADGTLTLESAATPTGYLTPTGVRYHITDHLGSVVGVVDGSNGALYQASEYAPYGERTDNASVTVSSAPAGETYRDQFTGKESQGPDFTVPYLDYGARLYSPTLYRWLTPDPLSEKYYDFPPYAYCAGNPVMMEDPDGRFPDIIWDIANVVLDVSSLWTNIKEGNTKEAFIDGGGLVVDVLAAVLPFVPGGAGTSIRATRAGEKIIDTTQSVKETTDIVFGSRYSIETIDNTSKTIKSVHGNSKRSTNAQHAYDIINTETGLIVKTGVSGGRIINGKSVRAERQVRKWNREIDNPVFKSEITKTIPAGEGSRDEILQYEIERARELKKRNHLTDSRYHKRP